MIGVIILVLIYLKANSVNNTSRELDYFSSEPIVDIIVPTASAIPTKIELPELIDDPVIFSDIQYYSAVSHSEVVEIVAKVDSCVHDITNAVDSGRYSTKAIYDMYIELARLAKIRESLQNDIYKFMRWEAEYPYATEVWYFLREHGYSEEVSAGILGNMMIETSGGSLILNPTIYDASGYYYGLCQWSKLYHSSVIGEDLHGQLEYLDDSMPAEFKAFGSYYANGFTFDDFLALEHPEDAAHAFAVVYERCASSSYGIRRSAAEKAYNYYAME